jgi:predicted helicase
MRYIPQALAPPAALRNHVQVNAASTSVQTYLTELQSTHATGKDTEHSHRGALEALLKAACPSGTQVINEAGRKKYGAPDFDFLRGGLPVGHVETKTIGENLDKIQDGKQIARYLDGADNLILTDYLEFRFFFGGRLTDTIRVGAQSADKKTLIPQPQDFKRLLTTLKDFAQQDYLKITEPDTLAERMAAKARRMQVAFESVLKDKKQTTLRQQLDAFRRALLPKLTIDDFSDVYAQTVAYGLFTARMHDPTQDDFSRGEALDLLPRSNPFLHEMFTYVTHQMDADVAGRVDELCAVLKAAPPEAILKRFGDPERDGKDAILHFYETFLAAYDKDTRKDRGVWYTPTPVVRFIVRAVDEALKTRFGLKDGLADTTKTKTGTHKVHILDPATGTGTFLAQTIRHIHTAMKGRWGAWSAYVERDLLPRLHGFELLMAPYAMCHLHLDLVLRGQTHFVPSDTRAPPRASVYLTNALEEYHTPDEAGGLLRGCGGFVDTVLNEAEGANIIKHDLPIMVAMGNPPYRGHSANPNMAWIEGLLEAYKREPTGGPLKERNAKWLNDDYVKFIRLGHHYVRKNGAGVLAYITNHAWLDNPTFRGMRHALMTAFDEIWVLDLHGNAKKKERAPDGGPDHNVFAIQQGVSILIAVKSPGGGKAGKLATVHHADLWGRRKDKFAALETATLTHGANWQRLEPAAPMHFFVPRDDTTLAEYQAGFALPEMFPVNSLGVLTKRDRLVYGFDYDALKEKIEIFLDSAINTEDACYRFGLPLKDRDKWSADEIRKNKNVKKVIECIIDCTYRPFDSRKLIYDKDLVARINDRVLSNLRKENICLIAGRQGKAVGSDEWNLCFCTNKIPDQNIYYRGGGTVFPLYRYAQAVGGGLERVPNLEPRLWARVQRAVPTATPEGVFDYIYAVLHAPQYRQRYAQFLKSDFPRIPWPRDAQTFADLAAHGAHLRALHLLEAPELEGASAAHPFDRQSPKYDRFVDDKAPRYEDGKVWINPEQCFEAVPPAAWAFPIGGYTPAQKWLKDRRGQRLGGEGIAHYQKIIAALAATARVMGEIEAMPFLP